MIKRTICGLSLSFLLGIYFGSKMEWLVLLLFLLLLGCMGAGLFALKEQIGAGAAMRLLLCIGLFLAGMARIHTMETVRTNLEKVLSEEAQITVLGKVSRKEEKPDLYSL